MSRIKEFLNNKSMKKMLIIFLFALLVLVVLTPTKNYKNSYTVSDADTADEGKGSSASEGNGILNSNILLSEYYEDRLKDILEKTYGTGNVYVMVNVLTGKSNQNENYYDLGYPAYDDKKGGDDDIDYGSVQGVLVVVCTDDKGALADITNAVCAIFNLPAHKVAVMVKMK